MQDKHIALVGLPNSGKTALLTALCLRREECTPANSESADFCKKNFEIFKNGKWENWKSTDPNSKVLELEFLLSFKKSKIILQSEDFAGEVWDKFIDAGDEQVKSKIGHFLKNAKVVAICFDLQIKDDYKQRFMVKNICDFLKKNKFLCDVGLVITKYDAIEDFIKTQGGLEKVLKAKLGVSTFEYFNSKKRIFPVSVAEFEFNPELKVNMPIPHSPSRGMGVLENWLYGSQTRFARVKKRCEIEYGAIKEWVEEKYNELKEFGRK